MASIVTRKNSFAVVYMTTVNGVRKQKWETYHTLPEAVRRKEQLELYHDLRKSKKIGGEVETVVTCGCRNCRPGRLRRCIARCWRNQGYPLLTTSRADRSCLPPRCAASTKCFTAPLSRQSFGSMWIGTHSIGYLYQSAGQNRRHF